MKRALAIGFVTISLLTILLLPGNNAVAIFDPFDELPGYVVTRHSYYILEYNEDREQADWIAYRVFRTADAGLAERTDRFLEDDSIPGGSATSLDYSHSGYDRGHLVPAADMSFSETAMAESFMYSNISPQLPGFNRGIWKRLEDEVRDWTEMKDTLFIVTGPVFEPGEPERIGPNGVAIPSAFFKIILDYTGGRIDMIAFLIPHEEGLRELHPYIVTVDSVEEVTGLDFFSGLPDRLEKRLERETRTTGWY